MNTSSAWTMRTVRFTSESLSLILPPVRPVRRWHSSLRTRHLNITTTLPLPVLSLSYPGRRRRCWEIPRRGTDWRETSFLLATLPSDRLGTSDSRPHLPAQVPGWPWPSLSPSIPAWGSRRTPCCSQLGTSTCKHSHSHSQYLQSSKQMQLSTINILIFHKY